MLQCQIFPHLWEAQDIDVDINRTWEIIREDINIPAIDSPGYYELKKHKPWFNKG
jgi:hypothetical protein